MSLLEPLYTPNRRKIEISSGTALLTLDFIRDYVDQEHEDSKEDQIIKSILMDVHNLITTKLNKAKKSTIKIDLKLHESLAFSKFLINNCHCHFSYRIELDQVAAQIQKSTS